MFDFRNEALLGVFILLNVAGMFDIEMVPVFLNWRWLCIIHGNISALCRSIFWLCRLFEVIDDFEIFTFLFLQYVVVLAISYIIH